MKEKSTIEEQFDLIANEYDSGRRKFIPCFDDYYENTTAFAASFIGEKHRILDLGSGTGLLAMYYFHHYPQADYILADVASEMLNVARQRFEHISNVNYSVIDYARELPDGNFDLVISALSIHHLENEQKQELFRKLKNKITPGGWFINYDQFCCESKEMDEFVNTHWIKHLYNSGLSETELERWQERRKLDRECSVGEEIAMLKKCGYESVECIYLCGKFAVIAARV